MALFFNPTEENLSLRLNSWCGRRRDPQSLTSRWKTTHCSFLLVQCARRPEAPCCPFARTRRNTDGFHFWFRFARRLFRSFSSGLAGDFLLADLPTSLQAVALVTTAVRSHFCDGHFVFVNFGPETNFALRWSPTSRAKLRGCVYDYTQFDWWGPAENNATQILDYCYSTCSTYLYFTRVFVFLMTFLTFVSPLLLPNTYIFYSLPCKKFIIIIIIDVVAWMLLLIF